VRQTDRPGFRRLSERVVYDGHVIRLAIGLIEAPDGQQFEREIVHHPGAVSVVPLLDDGRVVLVRQYRAPLDREVLEIPAGKRDVAGEPPETTARRELEEETGLRAAVVEKLVEFHNSVGFCDEHSQVFLARELQPVAQDLQGVEEQHLTIERVPLADALAMIDTGTITDAKTVIGLTLTARRLGC
jgi:ADP-ribose pyrophosphatase